MYRYFASKDEMIRAAISGSMDEFETLAADVERDNDANSGLDYLKLLLSKLQQFRRHTDGVDLFRLAIQGWAHAQSQPETLAVVTESFARQSETFRRAATRWAGPGRADAAGSSIGAAVIGYVVLNAFSPNDIDIDEYCMGLSALDGNASAD